MAHRCRLNHQQKKSNAVFLIFFVIALPVFLSEDFKFVAAEFVNEIDAEAADGSATEGLQGEVFGIVDVAKALGVENVVDVNVMVTSRASAFCLH